MDKYYEQLTPSYRTKLYEIYLYLIIVMVIIFAITITSILPVGIVSAALGVLFYFLRQKEYLEYEYIFTSGDIDIDMVIAAKKRKNIINFNMNEVIMMAPQGSSALYGMSKGKKVIAYTKDTRDKIFVAIVNKNNSINEIYFTPNEEFVGLCFKSNPKNVKKI